MSFGASAAVRFENQGDGSRRPVIFWEEQAKVAGNTKKPKKLKYKTKEQPYPLRNQQNVAAVKPDKPPLNKPLASRKPATSQVTNQPANKKTAGVQNGQTGKVPVNNKAEHRHYGAKKKKVPETAGTVVLTQKEFDAILDTIGQLAVEADINVTKGQSSKNVTGNNLLDDPGKSIELTPAVGVHNTGAPSRGEQLAVAKELPPSPVVPASKDVTHSSTQPAQQNNQFTAKQLPPSPTPYSQTLPHQQAPKHAVSNAVTSVNQQKPTQTPAVTTSMEKPLGDVLKSVRGIPLAHMTKAERKRLQWEQERAEQMKETDWNPWGRPGGGAPIKDNTGNILADYKTRALDSSVPDQITDRNVHISQPKPSFLPPARTLRNPLLQSPAALHGISSATHTQPPQVSKAPVSMMQTAPVGTTAVAIGNQSVMANTTTAAVTTSAMPPPAAIRSSLVIGEAEPNEKRFESAKEQQRRLWLAELEKQREEQRLRKLSERTSRLQGETYDTWADHFSTYKPVGLPNQQVSPPKPAEVQNVEATQRINSAPVVPPAIQAPSANDGESQSDSRTYLRGQNVFIDPQTLQELDEKRRKQLEYQEFIRKQIEEKERQKREEKERRMREEQEEEEKMRRERERIETRLQEEKNQVKVKEEQERKRLEALQQAMTEAQLRAEQEKHAKRLSKLQQSGHDTSHLVANLEQKLTSRNDGASSTLLQSLVTNDHHSVEQPRAQPMLQEPGQSYGGTRVLTPSKFRKTPASEPNSPRKEFGVQTDPQIGVLDLSNTSRESTDVEYRGPIQEKRKKVRVKSAPKEELLNKNTAKRVVKGAQEKNEMTGNKRPQKLGQRPSWGYQNPRNKRPIKQSEKDPFFEEKMHKREMMKTQRQNALQRMAEKYSPKASKSTTVSSRARSRSQDRDESEERNVVRRSRSRSPAAERSTQAQHTPRKDMAGHSGDSPGRHGASSRNSSQAPAGRSASPPVPAIKHRMNTDNTGDSYYQSTQARDLTSRTNSRSEHNKYQDQDVIQAPVKNSDFVPFIRSSNILDPAHAESPVPLSREPSVVERARRAYVQECNPAKFGFQMENYKDDGLQRIVAPNRNKNGVNPILNPEAVKEHPTSRQTQILQHLSELRRGLMQKQRELELEQAVCVE